MAKTLKELANDLRELIIDLNSDARNSHTFRPERYNNLKIEMDVSQSKTPYIDIYIGMSMARYDLESCERLRGSLGPDERFVQRWFTKMGVIANLHGAWKVRMSHRGKITEPE